MPGAGHNRGVIVIQAHPWRRNIPLVLVVSLVLGLLLSRVFSGVLFTPLAQLLAAVGGVVLCFAIVVGALSLAYPTVAYDPRRRVVRLGSRVVPLDTLHTVERRISDGGRSATLIYRLRSADGAAARVLVAGRPFRGLDEAGRSALTELLRIAPIRTDDPRAAKRAAVAANLVADNSRVPVSAEFAITELAAFDSPVATAEPAPDTAPEIAPADLEAMARDDEAAAAAIADLPRGPRVTRRVAGIALWIATAATIVVAVTALIVDGNGGDIDDAAPIAFGLIALTFATAGLAWTISAELDVRARRRAAMRWLDGVGDAERGRGLPMPFAAAWMELAPGHRALTAGAFVAGMIGMVLVIAGCVLFFFDDTPPGVAAIVLLIGLAVGAIGILGWQRVRRRRRADAAWVVAALGPRVGAGT